jgi:hypothetical protein
MTRLSCHRFPLQPSAAGTEPAGLQPGQFVAATGATPTNQELVADKFAATAGEDRRTAGETCALVLVIAGGRTSDAKAVRGNAGSDRSAPDADRIESWRPSQQRNPGITGGRKQRCCKSVGISGKFRRCWCGSQTVGALQMEIVSQCREQARWVYDYRRV